MSIEDLRRANGIHELTRDEGWEADQALGTLVADRDRQVPRGA